MVMIADGRDGLELYVIILVALAGFGGFNLGLSGGRKDEGVMGSIFAALIFAVPMGFWFVFNVFAYAVKGARSGFRPDDVRSVVGLLLTGVVVWLGAAIAGYVQRLRTRR